MPAILDLLYRMRVCLAPTTETPAMPKKLEPSYTVELRPYGTRIDVTFTTYPIYSEGRTMQHARSNAWDALAAYLNRDIRIIRTAGTTLRFHEYGEDGRMKSYVESGEPVAGLLGHLRLAEKETGP